VNFVPCLFERKTIDYFIPLQSIAKSSLKRMGILQSLLSLEQADQYVTSFVEAVARFRTQIQHSQLTRQDEEKLRIILSKLFEAVDDLKVFARLKIYFIISFLVTKTFWSG
jgi:hypothetical protein